METGVRAKGEIQVERWREAIAEKRKKLFRQNWKNRRNIPALISKVDADTLQFLLEWIDEYKEVVGREQERNLFDRLIALGLDVNNKENHDLV